jgi:hypothetical protein
MKKIMFLDADGVFLLGTAEGGVALSSKAVDLINWVSARGVEICFVTDRRNSVEPAALLDLFRLYGITGELSVATPNVDWQVAIEARLTREVVSHFVVVDDTPSRYTGKKVLSAAHGATPGALSLQEHTLEYHLVTPSNRYGLLEKSMPDICRLLDLEHKFVRNELVAVSDDDL